MKTRLRRGPQRSAITRRSGRPRIEDDPGFPAMLEQVRRMSAAGHAAPAVGAVVGKSPDWVRKVRARYRIPAAKSVDARPVLILIRPLRQPGPGISGSGGFDLYDTGEL